MVGAVRKFAYDKRPPMPSKGKTGAGKALNGLTAVGTKVGQWTVRPGLKAYDVGKGRRK
jgi:hypothetical protein